jgi:hypothetical protein
MAPRSRSVGWPRSRSRTLGRDLAGLRFEDTFRLAFAQSNGRASQAVFYLEKPLVDLLHAGDGVGLYRNTSS